MNELKFSVVLQSIPVVLTGADGVDKKYTLRELTGAQRATYNESFDVKIEMVDGEARATAGDNFKMMTGAKFLAMCLFDEQSKLVSEEDINVYPATVVQKLYDAAMKLSGMDAEALATAKNVSAGSDSIG